MRVLPWLSAVALIAWTTQGSSVVASELDCSRIPAATRELQVPSAADLSALPRDCRVRRPTHLCSSGDGPTLTRFSLRCPRSEVESLRIRDTEFDGFVRPGRPRAFLTDVTNANGAPLLCRALRSARGFNVSRLFRSSELCDSGAGGGVPPYRCYRISGGRRTCLSADTAQTISSFGYWTKRSGAPAFVYTGDHETMPEALWDPIVGPPTRRHWLMLGNRATQFQVSNDGTLGVFDETLGTRWLTAPYPKGTGISLIEESDGRVWGSDYELRSPGPPPERTMGGTWFEIRDQHQGLALERTVIAPEGEVPWLLIRVRLTLSADSNGPRDLVHTERWALRPLFLNLYENLAIRQILATKISYDVQSSDAGLIATEQFPSPPGGFVIGDPAVLVLERLGMTTGTASEDGANHPTLEIRTDVTLLPGETRELWFRFGRRDGSSVPDPAALLTDSLQGLAARLPRAAAPLAPEAAWEIPWHAAILTGGASRDDLLGGHTLNQASTYTFDQGANIAARDPLQHAIPLVYSEPDLALSVLKNSCAWADVNGDLPYGLSGKKEPSAVIGFDPSDQNLWLLWLAAEYAAATGDLAAFDDLVPYHPSRGAPAVPLREHLRRQFRFFVDGVGRGERGFVRIMNADWNDSAISEAEALGIPRADMIASGSSVTNTAMAAWVLRAFAGLGDRLGETALSNEARAQADELRELVKLAWNGRWFHRAYAPGGHVIGDVDCRLEVQPWAILSGAATPAQARELLHFIDGAHRKDSPLGARVRYPLIGSPEHPGELSAGGTWFAINMTLVWAAAKIDPEMAWDEWRRMTLASHSFAYPDIWEGTTSGPDSFNAPESSRPGNTWAIPPLLAMQRFPVNNLHAHAQPILAYLRLLGVEPGFDGSLHVGGGGRFVSPSFRLEADGRGSLLALGLVTVDPLHDSPVSSGPGAVNW